MADGKLTLDDVRAILYGTENWDPIAEDPEEVTDSGTEIIVAGRDDNNDGGETGDYAEDLRMVQEGDGVRLHTREPGTEEWDDPGVHFTDLDDLHTWIYEL